MTIRQDGSGLRRLTENDDLDQSPGWSPDGRMIVFRSDRDGDDEIWVMRADGTRPRLITVDPAYGGLHPDWQPRCTVLGSSGDDELTGTPGDDLICGLGGNDVIEGSSGDDLIFAGDGDDTIAGGEGDDVVVGGPGGDQLAGQSDDDRVVSRDGVVGNDSVDGGPGVDVCLTDPGDISARCP